MRQMPVRWVALVMLRNLPLDQLQSSQSWGNFCGPCCVSALAWTGGLGVLLSAAMLDISGHNMSGRESMMIMVGWFKTYFFP